MNSHPQYFDQQACPVCKHRNYSIVYKELIHTCHVLKKAGIGLKNDDVPADIVQCKNCGHKYLSLVIKDEFINYYYSVPESEYYDTVINKPYDRRAKDTKKFANLIYSKCREGKTVLEIGCGMGHLLFQLKQKGFECFRVDPSNFATSYARTNLGLNVISGMLDYNTLPEKRFDIIILSDVVEHIYNINSLMELVTFYLTDSGRVVILTGNSNSWYAKVCGKRWLYFFSWEHVSFFNKHSIKYLFNNHSLSLTYFKTTRHTGSYWQNIRLTYLTLQSAIANFLGLRKHIFYYYEAFDHFITIGQKTR
jgi:2-polyprenyl-3-methyl-5-hydroxy-6-metoxy-1,4-benzoquinol methylase